jgi:predicted DCC family thiol-disulfide oxidoreductase YuxK
MGMPSPATESGAAGISASGGRPVVLFDGVCNLCNATVNFLIDRDPPGRLRFAALQSNAAKNMLGALGASLPEGPPESILLVEGGHIYQGSTAALRIARHLANPGWRLAAALLAVPRPLRDAVYRWIAKNRYGWFGRADVCRVPTGDLRSRFLE